MIPVMFPSKSSGLMGSRGQYRLGTWSLISKHWIGCFCLKPRFGVYEFVQNAVHILINPINDRKCHQNSVTKTNRFGFQSLVVPSLPVSTVLPSFHPIWPWVLRNFSASKSHRTCGVDHLRRCWVLEAYRLWRVAHPGYATWLNGLTLVGDWGSTFEGWAIFVKMPWNVMKYHGKYL